MHCSEKEGIIEVKSFIDASQVKFSRKQAAGYACQTGLNAVTLALFVPVDDGEVLKKLSGDETIEGVRVMVSAIGCV